jgi:uncharacterized protein (TIGR02145 family)
MKKIITILIFAIASNAFAQQTPKTFTGPYSIGNNDGTATYTYFEQNGERVIDGNFSFNCPTENITITGKYSKGKKTGLWTRKQIYSRYNGMAVVKADLKWPKVTENTPFKEVTDLTTENYLNNKLEGVWTQTKTVKNSWGYPAPGGTSSSVFIVKKNFVADEMTSIEATRKKNDKINLSLKGEYKNKLVQGNWLFNDNKNTYSYTFNNGYLTKYEIKEIGTGKMIDSKMETQDIELQNNFFTPNENSYEIKMTQDYNKDTIDAKIFIQNINENLRIYKLCKLNKAQANFQNLDISLFTNAFGNFTPYKMGDTEVIGLGSSIKCEVLSGEDLYNRISFPNIKTEKRFLEATCNSSGLFMNSDWQADGISPSVAVVMYFFQLKNYIYKRDTFSLKNYPDFMTRKNINFQYSNSQIETNDHLLFLKALILNDSSSWKSFIDKYYSIPIMNLSLKVFINQKIDELKTIGIEFNNIDKVTEYLQNKDIERHIENEKYLSSITEVKIGNQVWMSENLKLKLENSSNYTVFENKYYYSLDIENKSICPKGWRIPSKQDWTILITTLGGDPNIAYEMLSKEELGFHPDFSNRRFEANKGWTFYKSFTETRNVIIMDKNKLQIFDLYDYIRGDYEGTKDYLPCRCIKE